MENLWAILVRRIYADNKQYATVHKLKEATLKVWKDIDTKTLIGCIQNRIF